MRSLLIWLSLLALAPGQPAAAGGPDLTSTSPRTYHQHCRKIGTQATVLRSVRSRSGAVRRLPRARKVAEVVTSPVGMQRYMQHVGRDTVELIFNPHSSSNGHMLIRAGDRVYDLGNTRSACARTFTALGGRAGMVGVVYRVEAAQVPQIQRRLQSWVDATTHTNLPIFDGYGKPVNLKPANGRFEVASRSKRMHRAQGAVQAHLVQLDGQTMLQADGHPAVAFPVLSQKKDGTIKVDTLTCTSFCVRALQETAPQLKLDRLGELSRSFARSTIVKLVRGKAPVTPDLVTVYNSFPGQNDIRGLAEQIGKR